jgi:ricin-type beta-trefoil lectin protein
MNMTLPIVFAIAGSIALLVGLFGGGVKAKEIEVPRISVWSRISSSLIGAALITVAIWLSFISPSQASDTPSPTSTGIKEISVLPTASIISPAWVPTTSVLPTIVPPTNTATNTPTDIPTSTSTITPTSTITDTPTLTATQPIQIKILKPSVVIPAVVTPLTVYSQVEIQGLGQCLDIPSGDTTPGTLVQIYPCHGGPNQQWTFFTNGEIQVLGQCLDIPSGNAAPNTLVQIYPCHGGPNQQWTFTTNGEIQGLGMCLDIPSGNTEPHTLLQIFPCRRTSNQIWSVVATK